MADYIKLHMPIFGIEMFHKLYLSRSLSTMGTMITSGVQVLDCLAIVKDVAGNYYYEQLWQEVHTKVQNGSQLSFGAAHPVNLHSQVSGPDDHVRRENRRATQRPRPHFSSYMEEDLRTAIKTATQFIEPVMIGMMGFMIGGVAMAMLMLS